MNIAELKDLIKDLPNTMEVCIKQTCDEFPLALVETGNVIEANFSEDVGGTILGWEKVFILTDENT